MQYNSRISIEFKKFNRIQKIKSNSRISRGFNWIQGIK